MFFQYAFSLQTCSLKLNKIFAATVFFDTSCRSELHALQILRQATTFFSTFCNSAVQVMQLCVCVDLILTLNRPFEPKESRMLHYLFYSMLIGLIQGCVVRLSYIDKELLMFLAGLSSALLVMAVWTCSIFSVIYGIMKLCKPNVSQSVRHLIIARHITTIIVFLLTQLYLQVGSLVIFTGKPENYLDGPFAVTLKILYGFQGFVLPLTRIYEPFFYSILVRKIRELHWPCIDRICSDAVNRERLDDLTFLQRGIKAKDLNSGNGRTSPMAYEAPTSTTDLATGLLVKEIDDHTLNNAAASW